MVAGIPAVLLAVETEQREFDDPEEMELVVGNNELALGLENVGAIEADLAEDFAGVEPLVGGEEDQVALLDFEFFGEGGFFGGVEEFDDGRFPFAAFNLDPGQASRAEAFGVVGHRFDLALRGGGHALCVQGLDDAAGGHRAAEHLEFAGAKFLREIGQFHAEPGVRFVAAPAVEGVGEGNAGEGNRHVEIEGEFPEALEEALDEDINVLALDEAHFEVQLGEFKLAVGPLVFVAEAACDLIILLDAGDHEHLFELLGRLRQGIKGARLASVGNQEFARAFGGGLEENGRFDFDEALLVHVGAGGGGGFGAEAKVAGHFRAAEIEVAVLKAEFFVDGAGDLRVVHGKGEDFGQVEKFEGGGGDFDFAGGNFGIVGAGGAGADLAGDGDDAFGAEGGGAVEKFRGQIGRVEDGLGAAFAVADVNKYEAAEVAAGMNPAGKDDGLPGVFGSQLVAVMGAGHECGMMGDGKWRCDAGRGARPAARGGARAPRKLRSAPVQSSKSKTRMASTRGSEAALKHSCSGWTR